MLELYFEKNWALPEQIVMVADEEAAIVSFSDPKGIVSFNMFKSKQELYSLDKAM